MRRLFAFAAVVAFVTACSSPPDCSTMKTAAIAGGPVGLIFDLIYQCPPTAPLASPPAQVAPPVAQTPVAVVAQQQDMATTPPPADMGQQHDMTPAPDLAEPLPPNAKIALTVSDPGNWSLSGNATRTSDGSGVAVTAGYDFVRGAFVDGVLRIPVTPLEAYPSNHVPDTRLDLLTLDIDLVWGPTSPKCPGGIVPGRWFVQSGTSTVCVPPTISFQLFVGGQLALDPGRGVDLSSLPSHLTMAMPYGQFVFIKPGDTIELRLFFDGDVTVSSIRPRLAIDEGCILVANCDGSVCTNQALTLKFQ